MMSDVDPFHLLEESGSGPPWPDGADHAFTKQQSMEGSSQMMDYFQSMNAYPPTMPQGLLASFDYTDPSLTSSISTSPDNAFRTESTTLEEQDLDAFGLGQLPSDLADFDLFPPDEFYMWPSGSVDVPWDYCPPHPSSLAMELPFTDSDTSPLQNSVHGSMVLDHEEIAIVPSEDLTATDLQNLLQTPETPRDWCSDNLPKSSGKKRYMCGRCSEFSSGFQSKKDLRRHKLLHRPAASRPSYYCAVRPGSCQKQYTRKDNLRRHYRDDHGLSASEALSQTIISGSASAK